MKEQVSLEEDGRGEGRREEKLSKVEDQSGEWKAGGGGGRGRTRKGGEMKPGTKEGKGWEKEEEEYEEG